MHAAHGTQYTFRVNDWDLISPFIPLSRGVDLFNENMMMKSESICISAVVPNAQVTTLQRRDECKK